MDLLNSLRHLGGADTPYAEEAKQAQVVGSNYRPRTITEILDAQIKWHESKIADLKAAKEAISPEVERALNALARLS